MLLIATFLLTAHAAEPDLCGLHTWPADGAEDVPEATDRMFLAAVPPDDLAGESFEPGGFEVDATVGGHPLRDLSAGTVTLLGRELGPDLFEAEIRWDVNGEPCARTVSFRGAVGTPEADFDDLQLDRFDVGGGRRASLFLEGAFPGDGDQVLLASGPLMDQAWWVPTEAEPAFSQQFVSAANPRGEVCFSLSGYAPATGTVPLQEACDRGCSTLRAPPAPWLLAAPLLLLARRRRHDWRLHR